MMHKMHPGGLASGLWGIEQDLEPDAGVRGNAYDQQLSRVRFTHQNYFIVANDVHR